MLLAIEGEPTRLFLRKKRGFGFACGGGIGQAFDLGHAGPQEADRPQVRPPRLAQGRVDLYRALLDASPAQHLNQLPVQAFQVGDQPVADAPDRGHPSQGRTRLGVVEGHRSLVERRVVVLGDRLELLLVPLAFGAIISGTEDFDLKLVRHSPLLLPSMVRGSR